MQIEHECFTGDKVNDNYKLTQSGIAPPLETCSDWASSCYKIWSLE